VRILIIYYSFFEETLPCLFHKRWKERWRAGEKGAHLRAIACEIPALPLRLYRERKKAHSSLLIQLRTDKIGFNSFLYERRVLEVVSNRCDYSTGIMLIRHVLLCCLRWAQKRIMHLIEWGTNLKRILSSFERATAAIRFILSTNLLK
jgi:hypothetical protein